jgi:hypothetical protein
MITMNTLLKYQFKWLGISLILLGIVLTVAYFSFNFRFLFPVFAVYSEFMEIKTFTTFTTNFADELILIVFLSGFFLLIFSAEKNENTQIQKIRAKAMKNSLLFYFGWLFFSVLFVFGNGFISILILNLILPFVIYLCFFYALKFRIKAKTQK